MSRLSTTGLSCSHDSSKNTTSLTHQNLFSPWMRHHASWTSVLGKLGTLLPGDFNSSFNFGMKIGSHRPYFHSLCRLGWPFFQRHPSLPSKSKGRLTCQIPSFLVNCHQRLID